MNVGIIQPVQICSKMTRQMLRGIGVKFKVGDWMKPLKNKVSITLDEDVIERIKQLAESDDRSFSQYINMVLKEHLIKIDGTAEK